VEMIAGLCLILGVWVKPARWITGAMLVLFMIAISINLARGNAIDCGCFDTSAANKTYDERIADMWFVLIRDTGMLLMIAQMWWAERVRGRAE
jgi:putative oxidoreductase